MDDLHARNGRNEWFILDDIVNYCASASTIIIIPLWSGTRIIEIDCMNHSN